jgi:hypothetical protein
MVPAHDLIKKITQDDKLINPLPTVKMSSQWDLPLLMVINQILTTETQQGYRDDPRTIMPKVHELLLPETRPYLTWVGVHNLLVMLDGPRPASHHPMQRDAAGRLLQASSYVPADDGILMYWARSAFNDELTRGQVKDPQVLTAEARAYLRRPKLTWGVVRAALDAVAHASGANVMLRRPPSHAIKQRKPNGAPNGILGDTALMAYASRLRRWERTHPAQRHDDPAALVRHARRRLKRPTLEWQQLYDALRKAGARPRPASHAPTSRFPAGRVRAGEADIPEPLDGPLRHVAKQLLAEERVLRVYLEPHTLVRRARQALQRPWLTWSQLAAAMGAVPRPAGHNPALRRPNGFNRPLGDDDNFLADVEEDDTGYELNQTLRSQVHDAVQAGRVDVEAVLRAASRPVPPEHRVFLSLLDRAFRGTSAVARHAAVEAQHALAAGDSVLDRHRTREETHVLESHTLRNETIALLRRLRLALAVYTHDLNNTPLPLGLQKEAAGWLEESDEDDEADEDHNEVDEDDEVDTDDDEAAAVRQGLDEWCGAQHSGADSVMPPVARSTPVGGSALRPLDTSARNIARVALLDHLAGQRPWEYVVEMATRARSEAQMVARGDSTMLRRVDVPPVRGMASSVLPPRLSHECSGTMPASNSTGAAATRRRITPIMVSHECSGSMPASSTAAAAAATPTPIMVSHECSMPASSTAAAAAATPTRRRITPIMVSHECSSSMPASRNNDIGATPVRRPSGRSPPTK